MKPVNREDLLARMPENRSQLDLDDAYRTSLETYIRKAEWFDFGRLSAETVAFANGTHELIQAGLVHPPYPISMFRACYEDIPDIDVLFLALEGPRLPMSYSTVKGTHDIVLVTFRARLDETAIMTITGLGPGGVSYYGMSDTEIQQEYASDCNTAVNTWLSLWHILNTKHVRKHVDIPSDKLNRARAKRGKPPLQRVTRIDTQHFSRALAETKRMENAGEKTSRRMHLRRGHWRHYTADRFRDSVKEKPKWIEHMIINADQDAAPRSKYEVLT